MGGTATVNTNDIPIASGQGAQDLILSQGQGYGLAVTNNIWFFAGIALVAIILIVVAMHYHRKG